MNKFIGTFILLLMVCFVHGQKQITIKASSKKQTIDGFGGSIAYYENWVVSHPKRTLIYDYLFRDLGLSILRSRNMYMNEGGTNTGVNDTKTIVSEGKKRSSFDIMMSSWSPPGKYKSNGKPANDETMATLATDASGNFVYGDFAKWWYKSLLDYKAKGIDIKYISIQNEPNWNPGYEGCIFMPTEQTVFDKILAKNVKVASYAKAFNAVYDTIAKYKSTLNVNPKMIGPEVLGIENAWSGRPGDYTKYMDMTKCYAVAHHLYTGTDPATMSTNMTILNTAYPAIAKMQTEYSDKDWLTLSQIIFNSLVIENVSAYLVWELIWPGSDFIDMENPWTSGSWVNPNGFKVGTKYYMFKQFAYFIKPGYSRVETSGSNTTLKVSAFLSQDSQKLSVIAINTSASPDSIAISPTEYNVNSGDIYRTTDKENCILVGTYSGKYIKLPPKSITTFALQGSPQTVGAKTVSVGEPDILVYPNPFVNEFTLNLKNFSSRALIEVYSLSGQIFYRGMAENNVANKIGSELPKGMYILSITDGKTRFTNKIIKQ
ncbi:MAG: T9SS type A sorting domain-containing protein [Prolixibacteraceae bacterium]|nr:T9SS type A sorting domain-containing protein [Prolixibacteraceae bacterium]